MTLAAEPQFVPGRVYRTRELRRWSANPSRLAKRLVASGELMSLAHGLFVHPKRSQFGTVPPRDQDLLSAFLDDTPFVFTGPDRWNALGLGTTAVFAEPLVYNHKRSGRFVLGGRAFQLRRVAFPTSPTPEWYVVDLLEHADQAGAAQSDVVNALTRALKLGRFDRDGLQRNTARYGTRATRELVDSALAASSV